MDFAAVYSWKLDFSHRGFTASRTFIPLLIGSYSYFSSIPHIHSEEMKDNLFPPSQHDACGCYVDVHWSHEMKEWIKHVPCVFYFIAAHAGTHVVLVLIPPGLSCSLTQGWQFAADELRTIACLSESAVQLPAAVSFRWPHRLKSSHSGDLTG